MATISPEELCCRGLLPAEMCNPLYLRSTENNLCDAPLYDYCKRPEGKYDTICACINSEIPFPDCFDKTCRGSGAFLPKNMIMQPCPTVLNCTQVVNIGEGAKNNLLNLSQYQYCGVDNNKTEVNPETGKAEATLAVENVNKIVDNVPVPKPTVEPVEPAKTADTETNRNIYIAFAVIAAIAVVGAAGAKMYRKKK
jgi:hypothetical protein